MNDDFQKKTYKNRDNKQMDIGQCYFLAGKIENSNGEDKLVHDPRLRPVPIKQNHKFHYPS